MSRGVVIVGGLSLSLWVVGSFAGDTGLGPSVQLTLDLNLILNGLTLGGVSWLLATVLGVKNCVAKINAWMASHDKQDDERHDEIMKNIDKLWERGE